MLVNESIKNCLNKIILDLEIVKLNELVINYILVLIMIEEAILVHILNILLVKISSTIISFLHFTILFYIIKINYNYTKF